MAAAWGAPTISGEEPELRPNRLSFIWIAVVVRTVGLLTIKTLSACMYLIVKRMILLLFPSMREFASVLVFAAIRICLNKMFCLPLGTLFALIIKHMGLPPEILPVVRVDAGISRMLSIRIGTPNCLEVKNVEISRMLSILTVGGKFVQKIHSDFLFGMSKGAHIAVIARIDSPRVTLTKLDLVLFRVIKLLYSVVRFGASVSQIAFITLLWGNYMLTDLGSIFA